MRFSFRVFIGALFGTLVLAGLLTAPASARTAQVQRVHVVAATSTSLTLTWNKVSSVKRYELSLATNYSMKGVKHRKLGKSNTYRITRLTPGKTYCFQVRALRGSSYGYRSQRSCKPTPVSTGAKTGTKMRVVTYNVCSMTSACARWTKNWQTGVKNLQAAKPDVIAFQEAGNPRIADGIAPIDSDGNPTGDYAYAAYDEQRILLYNRSTFDQAMGEPTQEACGYNDTFDEAGEWTGEEPIYCPVPNPRSGLLSLGHSEYAVWAELVSKATGTHVIVTSSHLTSGKTSTNASWRKSETKNLLAKIPEINPQGYPVIHAGDFNSNKKRGSLDTVAQVMNGNGYRDGFDLAQSLVNPNWNSSLSYGTKLVYAVQWGDHVDHVWVKPSIGVRKWQKLGNQNGPYPSDHFAVSVDLTVG